jgi:hypothetical protein
MNAAFYVATGGYLSLSGCVAKRLLTAPAYHPRKARLPRAAAPRGPPPGLWWCGNNSSSGTARSPPPLRWIQGGC